MATSEEVLAAVLASPWERVRRKPCSVRHRLTGAEFRGTMIEVDGRDRLQSLRLNTPVDAELLEQLESIDYRSVKVYGHAAPYAEAVGCKPGWCGSADCPKAGGGEA